MELKMATKKTRLARAKNFTTLEKTILVKIVANYPVIELKGNTKALVARKSKAWHHIEAEFNANENVSTRNKDVLKSLWKNVKTDARKELRERSLADLQSLPSLSHSALAVSILAGQLPMHGIPNDNNLGSPLSHHGEDVLVDESQMEASEAESLDLDLEDDDAHSVDGPSEETELSTVLWPNHFLDTSSCQRNWTAESSSLVTGNDRSKTPTQLTAGSDSGQCDKPVNTQSNGSVVLPQPAQHSKKKSLANRLALDFHSRRMLMFEEEHNMKIKILKRKFEQNEQLFEKRLKFLNN